MPMGSASALPHVRAYPGANNNRTTRQEAVMFRQPSDRPTPACNDNGSFFRHGPRTEMPSGSMLRAASETLGPICLSYVAHGVFIISSQEPTSSAALIVAALVRRKHSASSHPAATKKARREPGLSPGE